MAELRIRRAVRGLLLTPAEEILLVRFEFPTRTVWAAPGGGLEDGEDHLDALRRELREEVGLTDPAIGPHVWNREHIIPHLDGQWDGQRDRCYVVRTERFDPQPELTWDELRAERVEELRWWQVSEIEQSTATFAPRRLGRLLRSLVDDGPPATPIDTGV
ncbi:MAG: NUDIX domain-containing protein [Ilumatobacteraceae bacterium]|nr:NUDIX domain-containing protein [Ilumatobacteraceae bacterium]